MQLLVITFGAVGVYNPQVVVLHGACDDHQTSLFPPQCCIISMVCPSWSGGGCASAMLLITIFLACNCCGHSRSGHEGCICSV